MVIEVHMQIRWLKTPVALQMRINLSKLLHYKEVRSGLQYGERNAPTRVQFQIF